MAGLRTKEDTAHREGCRRADMARPWWLNGRTLVDAEGGWLVAVCNDSTCNGIMLVSLDDVEAQLSEPRRAPKVAKAS